MFLLGSPVGVLLVYPRTGTLGGTIGEVAFPNISARDISYYFCVFTSVNSGTEGDGLCSA